MRTGDHPERPAEVRRMVKNGRPVLSHKTKHTSSWLVIMWTLSDIITISFCLNLRTTSTYQHTTYN